MPEYILDNNAPQAANRFGALEALYDPVSIRHLEPFVGPGSHCLEVGGGSGSVALWMSRRVGQGGRVLVTDIEPRFLDGVAGENVEVRRHDIAVDALEPDSFDVAHTRLVLVHLPRRAAAVETMIAALKPGGWLVLQEFESVTMRAEPATFSAECRMKTMVAYQDLMVSRGVDIQCGRKLLPLLEAMGMEDVESEAHATLQRGGSPGASLSRSNFLQLRADLLASGRVTEDEFAADLARLDDPSVIWPSQVLWTTRGRKRG